MRDIVRYLHADDWDRFSELGTSTIDLDGETEFVVNVAPVGKI